MQVEGFATGLGRKRRRVDDDASSMELDDMPSDEQELEVEQVWHMETMCLAARERFRELRCPACAAELLCSGVHERPTNRPGMARAFRACFFFF